MEIGDLGKMIHSSLADLSVADGREPLAEEARSVGCQQIARTPPEQLHSLRSAFHGDQFDLGADLASAFGDVLLGSGTGVGTDAGAIDIGQRRVGTEAEFGLAHDQLPVIEGGGAEVAAQFRVAALGPSRGAEQYVYAAGCQHGEPFGGGGADELDSVGVAEYGRCHGAAEIGVEASEGSIFLRFREADRAITHAATQGAPVPDLGQSPFG